MHRDRATNHLNATRRQVGRLTTLESAWLGDALSADDRIGERAEWDDTIDRFSAVVHASLERQLDQDVLAQLVEVATLLVAFAPSLERMQLRPPPADDLRRLGILSAV